jgi:hypothetical protein
MEKSSVEKLLNLMENAKSIISVRAYAEVCHFYEHGEYEMAFEGLLIELIQSRKHPKNFIKEEWKTLGLQFELDKQSVFDCSIWEKFVNWIELEF